MLYEKKMLILSGSGKGVVLIEKSAFGAKFTLRTFDLSCRNGALKAGIVTKTKVFVRDLPTRDDPAATFTVELDGLDDLHFAVFDRELLLYGCTGKRMWEANLMGLLVKNDRRPSAVDRTVSAPPLPPIAPPPKTLPLPDGTGLPQSRLAVYGDDALAENDFYTQIDMASRMPTVDGFLDTPRVLAGLAPEITPAERTLTPSEKALNNAESEVTAIDLDELEQQTQETQEDAAEEKEMPPLDDETQEIADITEPKADNSDTQTEPTSDNSDETASKPPAPSDEEQSADVFEPIAEAAATDALQPWERTARWVKQRSGRELVVKKPRVKPLSASEKLKRLRSTEFFERARRDIDILFASARRDETLFGLIDDVEWVRVDVDGNSVSVGRSGNAFLCYAVAGTYERTPPLGEEAQWLPMDRAVPTGKGYWVIFQNLATGEIIK